MIELKTVDLAKSPPTNSNIYIYTELQQPHRASGQSYLLGTPDTSLSGLSTRMARKVRRSTPSSGLPTPATTREMGASGLSMVIYLENTWDKESAKDGNWKNG